MGTGPRARVEGSRGVRDGNGTAARRYGAMVTPFAGGAAATQLRKSSQMARQILLISFVASSHTQRVDRRVEIALAHATTHDLSGSSRRRTR
jgi:hypothetical protein